MPDHRMQALEDRVSVKVAKKVTEENKEGGCHIFSTYRKPGETVGDIPLSVAQALQAQGYAQIVGKARAAAETATTR